MCLLPLGCRWLNKLVGFVSFHLLLARSAGVFYNLLIQLVVSVFFHLLLAGIAGVF